MRTQSKIDIIRIMITEIIEEKCDPYHLKTHTEQIIRAGRTHIAFTATFRVDHRDYALTHSIPVDRINNCGPEYLYPFAVNTVAQLFDPIKN